MSKKFIYSLKALRFTNWHLKKHAFLVMFFAVILGSCSADVKQSNRSTAEASAKIKVYLTEPGTEILPHFSWPEKAPAPTGAEPYLIEKLMENCGLEYEFVTDFLYDHGDPRMEILKAKKANLCIRGITVNKLRSRDVLFTTPYYLDGLSALVLRDGKIFTKEDLEGKRIFAFSYTTGYDWARENLSEAEIITEKEVLISPEELIVDGKIDAFLIDFSFIKHLEKKNPKLRVLDEKFTKEPLAIAVEKSDTALLRKLNSGLEGLRITGELEKIIKMFE